MSAHFSYAGGSVLLRVGDSQTKYKGPRGPGGPVTVDGKVAMRVSNWGPDYLSFRAGGRGLVVKYTAPAWSQRGDAEWGTITSIRWTGGP